MDTNRIRKAVTKELGKQIERLSETQDDLHSWQPGDEWLAEDLMAVAEALAGLCDGLDDGSVADVGGRPAEDEDEDAEDEDAVKELDAELGFDDAGDDD